MAKLALTKQAAAHRLILAGVRMIARSDDPLAVHVVASSALNLIRELIQSRGPNYLTLAFREGIYRFALSRAQGEPDPFPITAEVDSLIDWIVHLIRSGQVASADDIVISGFQLDERKALDAVIGPFNFLKHAQRDPLATLNEEDIDPLEALTHAISAFSFLFPGERLPDEVAQFLGDQGVI